MSLEGMRFAGVEVIESLFLTEIEIREVRRSWRERLFSWPWNPIRGTKTVSVQVPSRQIVQLGRNRFLIHPAMKAELFKAVK